MRQPQNLEKPTADTVQVAAVGLYDWPETKNKQIPSANPAACADEQQYGGNDNEYFSQTSTSVLHFLCVCGNLLVPDWPWLYHGVIWKMNQPKAQPFGIMLIAKPTQYRGERTNRSTQYYSMESKRLR